MRPSILVVGVDPQVRALCECYLPTTDAQVAYAGTIEHARRIFPDLEPDVVVADLQGAVPSSRDLLDRIGTDWARARVLVIAPAERGREGAEAVRLGACGYLVKPVDLGELRAALPRCLMSGGKMPAPSALAAIDADAFEQPPAIGRSPQMAAIWSHVEALAHTDVPVLIRGAVGTGKELLARALHLRSHRASRRFLPVNCTAAPEPMLEAVLFGDAERTAASNGVLEHPEVGTVFLDEISDASLSAQGRILSALRRRDALGRPGPRVVAATQRSLSELAGAGRFLPALQAHLQRAELVVPPLRQRREDIPILAHHLLARASRELHKDVHLIPDAVMRLLVGYDWPGNVRELASAIFHAAVLARGPELSPDHLPPGPGPSSGVGAGDLSLEAVERAHVLLVLNRVGGNKRRAALSLGISRPRLDRLIEKYQLDLSLPRKR